MTSVAVYTANLIIDIVVISRVTVRGESPVIEKRPQGGTEISFMDLDERKQSDHERRGDAEKFSTQGRKIFQT